MNETQEFSKAVKLGLFAGRHEMPVDGYVFSADETTQFGYHEDLYLEAFERGVSVGRKATTEGKFVKFFLTGLTVAAIGVVDGLRRSGAAFCMQNYDASTKTYVSIQPR